MSSVGAVTATQDRLVRYLAEHVHPGDDEHAVGIGDVQECSLEHHDRRQQHRQHHSPRAWRGRVTEKVKHCSLLGGTPAATGGRGTLRSTQEFQP